MKLSNIYQKAEKPVISFEFFPPKTDKGEENLFEEIAELKALGPSFVSVTYGAMGTTRANTLRIVQKIKKEIHMEAAAHLTCIVHGKQELETILGDLEKSEVENIVALRGDRPKDFQGELPEDGFRYASELVKFIRRHPRYGNSFSLAVAGYPETHVECRDKKKDLEHLKKKVDEGADVILTQLFFDNTAYFDFVERARGVGIKIPIVPGIMPITNGSQIERFAEMCGAAIPEEIRETISELGDDLDAIQNYGIEYATRQCAELLKGGAPGLHFYTLNKSRATREIYLSLGLTPAK